MFWYDYVRPNQQNGMKPSQLDTNIHILLDAVPLTTQIAIANH